jgi:hypothetical protein
MTPMLLTLLLLVAAIVTAVTGLGWVAVPLFALAVACFIWAIVVFFRGGGQMPATHRTRKPELLGPGGPDDPDRAA